MKHKILKINQSALVFIDWANVYGWKKTLGWELDIKKLYDFLDSYDKIVSKNFYFGIEKDQTQSENFMTQVKSIGFTVISKELKWTPVSLEKSYFKKVVQDLFAVLDEIKINNYKFSEKLYRLIEKIKGLEIKEVYELLKSLNDDLKRINININSLKTILKVPVLRRKCDFDVEITKDALNSLNSYKIFILLSGDGDYASLVEDLLKKGKKVIVIFAPGHKGKEYNAIYNDIKSKKLNASLFMCSVLRLKDFLKK